MRIDVLVVVAAGQRAELLAETLAAGVVLAAAAIAVAAPVAERAGDPREQFVFHDHRPAFTHGDLVRRVERNRGQIAERARLLPVEPGPQGVAAILDEP